MLQKTLFFNEFNLLFPIFIYLDIYNTTESTHKKLLRTLLLIRLICTWAAILFLTYAWYFSTVQLVTTAIVLLSVVFILGTIEYHIFKEKAITAASDLARDNVTAFTVAFVGAACLPVNFFLNIVAPRTSLEQSVYAALQVVLRVGLVLFVVIIRVAYPDYKAAWSCYMSAPIKDYTKGYCPAYTKNYYDNFACRDSTPNNLACFGGELPSWKNPHIAVHIATLLVAAFYTQHIITAIISILRFTLL